MALNIVELVQEPDADCAFDQPCKFGHRVEGHAVYCHNDAWTDSPRKCRRTWYSGGEIKDEDCPGFQPNTEFKGALSPSPISGDRCSQCGGSKLIRCDKETVETCPRCTGDGTEPRAIEMTEYEQDTLEMSHTLAGRHPGERFVRIAEDKTESDLVHRLCDLKLVELRSVSWVGNESVYLLESTAKGWAVMQANWEARKNGAART
jgi:hypothetical protein